MSRCQCRFHFQHFNFRDLPSLLDVFCARVIILCMCVCVCLRARASLNFNFSRAPIPPNQITLYYPIPSLLLILFIDFENIRNESSDWHDFNYFGEKKTQWCRRIIIIKITNHLWKQFLWIAVELMTRLALIIVFVFSPSFECRYICSFSFWHTHTHIPFFVFFYTLFPSSSFDEERKQTKQMKWCLQPWYNIVTHKFYDENDFLKREIDDDEKCTKIQLECSVTYKLLCWRLILISIDTLTVWIGMAWWWSLIDRRREETIKETEVFFSFIR